MDNCPLSSLPMGTFLKKFDIRWGHSSESSTVLQEVCPLALNEVCPLTLNRGVSPDLIIIAIFMPSFGDFYWLYLEVLVKFLTMQGFSCPKMGESTMGTFLRKFDRLARGVSPYLK